MAVYLFPLILTKITSRYRYGSHETAPARGRPSEHSPPRGGRVLGASKGTNEPVRASGIFPYVALKLMRRSLESCRTVMRTHLSATSPARASVRIPGSE